jgi:hypothetical protein
LIPNRLVLIKFIGAGDLSGNGLLAMSAAPPKCGYKNLVAFRIADHVTSMADISV